jgi:hypothetical protein
MKAAAPPQLAVHTPATQCSVGLHILPQAPQLSVALVRSTQLPGGHIVVVGLGQVAVQAPSTQVWFIGQVTPQAPQLLRSVMMAA